MEIQVHVMLLFKANKRHFPEGFLSSTAAIISLGRVWVIKIHR